MKILWCRQAKYWFLAESAETGAESRRMIGALVRHERMKNGPGPRRVPLHDTRTRASGRPPACPPSLISIVFHRSAEGALDKIIYRLCV